MIGMIDYGAGNIASVINVLNDLNCEFIVTDKESDLQKCEKIIFPGVGEASFVVRRLHMSNLFTMLRILKKPLLGICLGMQLLCEKSKEGNVCGLAILPVSSEIFNKSKVKVPHMGWNSVHINGESKLFTGIKENKYFFFANSYYVPLNEFTVGISDYGVPFSAAIQKENYYGVQFHPEKSGEAGIQLIKNFIELC
jgi:imidazole glycerol-phosphate synthase subunit HisH